MRLLLLYMWLDLVRPSFVWHFPKILSPILFVTWLLHPAKRWPLQSLCMLLLLVVMVIDIPLASNTYTALWTSYGMAMVFLSMCFPVVQFVNTVERFQRTINALIAIYVVIGLWASFHQGYGPAGAGGGQDENYVTACMAMALPLLVYSSLSAKTRIWKILYLAPIPVVLLAVLVAENPSRGGFIGFLFVLGYIVFYSKKRLAAIVWLCVLALLVVAMAGPAYWNEIATITKTEEGTADHRKDLWFLATKMFLSYPLTGVGPDNFRWRLGDFQTEEITNKYGRSLGGSYVTHSLYFELIAELGLAGIILFSLIVLRNFRDLTGIRKRISLFLNHESRASSSADQQELKLLLWYAHGLTASLIAFLVCSAFVSTLYYSYFWLHSAIIAGFTFVADQAVTRCGEGQRELGTSLPNGHRLSKTKAPAFAKQGL